MSPTRDDYDLIEKLKKLIKVSQRIKISKVVEYLGISEVKFLSIISDLGDEMPIKIDDDYLVVEDFNNFADFLDEQFDTWGSMEASKIGKVDKLANFGGTSAGPVAEMDSKSAIEFNKSSLGSFGDELVEPAGSNSAIVHPSGARNDYHGTQFVTNDYEVMIELENLLGGTPIPRVQKIEYNTFGYIEEDQRVIGLGLHNKGLSSFPAVIGRLSNLKELWLYGNDLVSVPESIGELQSLQTLSLAKNKLTAIPASIGNLRSLQVLSLGNNNLTALPESIGNLLNLHGLWLGFNKLTALPETIGNLINLKELYIGYNQLSSLPETFGNLKSLESLWLNGNNLVNLPNSIQGLKNLKKLHLQGNSLRSLQKSLKKWMQELKKNGCEVKK
ncbi:MAG: leucine-rich repeat domain-containing protein [Promethearchaeota archaeon]